MEIFVIITAIAVFFANIWHIIFAWIRQPPHTVFIPVAHYFRDYYLYLSQFAQGASGKWLFADHLFTNETLPKTWIYWMYVLFGHLTFWIWPPWQYLFFLMIAGCGLLYIVYRVTKDIFGKDAWLAFLLVTTASNWPKLFHENLSLYGDFWFSPTPALNRLGGVPHQMVQTILCLLLIRLVGRIRPISLIVLSFLAACANPIQMIVVVLALFFTTEKKKWVILSVSAFFGALLTNWEFSGQPILGAAKAWEYAQHARVTLPQFAIALGPIGILSIIGLFKKKSKVVLPYVYISVISVFISISPIPELFHTSPVRWLSPVSIYGFAFLAVYGIQAMKRWMPVGLAAYILISYMSFIPQIEARTLQDLVYIPNDVITSLQTLHSTGTVLVDPSVPYDVLIPFLSGTKTFTGHPIHTLYPDAKESLRQKFFKREMNTEQEAQFIKNHTIRYIIISASNSLPYHEIARNTFIRIYEIYTK